MGGWSNTNKQRSIRRMDKYKDGDTIFILMTAEQCKSVMREWLERDYECDLNVMRSQKNKGKFVLKKKSLMWANRIIQWHGYEKVTYQIIQLMEEVIESLVAIIKDKTKDFTYLDQEQMFRDLSGRLNDMSLDAMKCEYLGERKEVADNE